VLVMKNPALIRNLMKETERLCVYALLLAFMVICPIANAAAGCPTFAPCRSALRWEAMQSIPADFPVCLFIFLLFS
jgi:hypothetical protein